jgi:hypothetical protein
MTGRDAREWAFAAPVLLDAQRSARHGAPQVVGSATAWGTVPG